MFLIRLLYEMEQINPEFPSTDVAVVIGANDVVNPDARDNPKSLIAGMPILEVDRAKSVIVLKRGQGRGFSGLENPLFFKPCTSMLYGDAKSSLSHLARPYSTSRGSGSAALRSLAACCCANCGCPRSPGPPCEWSLLAGV